MGTTRKEILIRGYDRVFLQEARACVRRSMQGAADGNPVAHGGAAASAIVAACSAVESFVSEHMAFHEANARLTEDDCERIRAGDSFQKLHRLVACFDSSGLARREDYEQLQSVFAVRHCVTHRQAAYLTTDEWPDIVDERHKRWIPYLEDEGLDWTSRVFNDRVAKWAVDTVDKILAYASSKVPEAPVGTRVNLILRPEPVRVLVEPVPDQAVIRDDQRPCTGTT